MFEALDNRKPAVILAPMEGVVDAPMRELLTRIGGYSFAVSEFLRLSQDVLPEHVYLDHMPELSRHGHTTSGVPVVLQLLGGDPDLLAKAALRGVNFGAQAIDINFGCPAPTVNRHDGGASLLKYPDRIENILKTIRHTLPTHIPLSCKMRLGWDDPESITTNAKRAFNAGISWLTIHARTKSQGYQPPVFWEQISKVKKISPVPIVANGDIWTIDDFRRCREITGCEHFMIGRSALANPGLANQIAHELGVGVQRSSHSFNGSLTEWADLLSTFADLAVNHSPSTTYASRRLKQWMKLVNSRTPLPWFDQIKPLQRASDIIEIMHQHRDPSPLSNLQAV
ncbi:MAG: tRNA-dihydrouridine synthase family protein [Oligoflexia bacterium]|nr:tRNA-dihydrouridine synthase family protein [Oligoflexia bacterium]